MRGVWVSRDRQRGQVIVLFALMLTVIMGFAAVAVDVGVLRRANQELWSALDASWLAGASQLPGNGANAEALALEFAPEELPWPAEADIAITFRCLVGDRDGNGVYDSSRHAIGLQPRQQRRRAMELCRRRLRGAVRAGRGRQLQHDRRRLGGDRPVPLRPCPSASTAARRRLGSFRRRARDPVGPRRRRRSTSS